METDSVTVQRSNDSTQQDQEVAAEPIVPGLDITRRIHCYSKDFKFMTVEQFKEWVERASGMSLQLVKKQKHAAYGFVGFDTLEQKEEFRSKVNKVIVRKNDVLCSDIRTDAETQSVNEARADLSAKKREEKKRKRDVALGLTEQEAADKRAKVVPQPVTLLSIRSRKIDRGIRISLAERTTPLSKYSYDEQLRMKYQFVRNAVRTMTRLVRKTADDNGLRFPDWARGNKNHIGCPVLDCIPSPENAREGYRNKCEFTIGYNEEDVPMVGFVNTVQGSEPLVGDVADLVHVPSPMKALAKHWSSVIATSEYKPCRRSGTSGTWRTLMARLAVETKQMMVLVQLRHDQAEQQKIVDYILQNLVHDGDKVREFDGVPITSLYLQYNDAVSDATDGVKCPMNHVWGLDSLKMQLCGTTFDVAPTSFFQSNLITCAKLYDVAIDWLDPRPESSVLLDVCCGVGTIGLCARDKVKHIIGVDMVPEAIDNARENARRNGVEAATYYAGKAEDHMQEILAEARVKSGDTNDIVAIVDPPRAGLHSSVISSLRSCDEIKMLSYISCNPDTLARDGAKLCDPCATFDPFVPFKAVPVDMFPHTSHVEMVMIFKRQSLMPKPDPKASAEPTEEEAEAETVKEPETVEMEVEIAKKEAETTEKKKENEANE